MILRHSISLLVLLMALLVGVIWAEPASGFFGGP